MAVGRESGELVLEELAEELADVENTEHAEGGLPRPEVPLGIERLKADSTKDLCDAKARLGAALADEGAEVRASLWLLDRRERAAVEGRLARRLRPEDLSELQGCRERALEDPDFVSLFSSYAGHDCTRLLLDKAANRRAKALRHRQEQRDGVEPDVYSCNGICGESRRWTAAKRPGDEAAVDEAAPDAPAQGDMPVGE